MKHSSAPDATPPRWIDGSDDTAFSLRAYEKAVRGKPSVPLEHFLRGRSKRQTQTRIAWAMATSLACGSVFAFLGSDLGASFFGRGQELEIAAEKLDKSRFREESQPASKAASGAADEQDAADRPSPSDESPSSPELMERGFAPNSARSAKGGSAKGVTDGRAKAPLQDCQLLAASSKFSEAASCYGKVATTSASTTAELAWLEKARLEARALGRADLALQTLAAYKAKFPKGALAHEASVAEKRNLAALERKPSAPSKPKTP